ncbi:protein PSK SIMULATOR 1-like [Miscanthus floridulus]|uniref:protein PSK SIMULATOR 1-like n=1 Tax=Miscanthus floridulus TaxID=154761 RepID=UPI003457B8EE
MVAEPLVHKLLSMATLSSSSSSSSKKARPAASANANKGGAEAAAAGDGRLGILSFEVANDMSRAANLYRSLSDDEAARLLGPRCLGSHAVRALVVVPGDDDARLLALALAEKLDALNRVADVASRLGRARCTVPALMGFDHVYADLLSGRSGAAAGALFTVASASDTASLVRKLDRLAAATAALYAELQALADLEQSARKLPTNEARRVLQQRARWRRHDVRRLRDASLWNWTYDRAVLLLARAVCAIYDRIRHVFGDPMLGLDLLAMRPSELSGQCGDQSRRLSRPVAAANSGPVQSYLSDKKSGPISRVDPEISRPVNFRSSGCGASPGKMFMECLSLSSSVTWKDGFEDEFLEDSSCISTIRSGMLVPFSSEQGVSTITPSSKSGRIGRKARFGPKSTVTSLAPPSTVGGSALALHYANIVIIIEKLLRYPHLVGEEARDDLYQMLPSSLKVALRKNLKTYVKSMAIYDAFLAHDWRETLEKTLAWLAPMAHNMIRWQAERNFEQQQIVLKGNVLLLQTLYFADREKTEAVICELLVGLNYICRYEQQQNALLDCSSSLDFDDCVEWQLQ